MQTLQTNRLTLRIFEAEDLEAVFAIMQQADVGTSCATIGKNPSKAISQAWIDKAIKEFQAEEAYIYAIVLNQQVIGSIGLHLKLPEKTTAEIGYWLDNNAWGKGFALEACKAITEDLLPQLKSIHTLIATTAKDNQRSGKLLLQLGLEPVGETLVTTIEGIERPSLLYEKRLGSLN